MLIDKKTFTITVYYTNGTSEIFPGATDVVWIGEKLVFKDENQKEQTIFTTSILRFLKVEE